MLATPRPIDLPPSAHDRVYRGLRTRIMLGQIAPGEALTLRGIGKEFDRNAWRGILRQLLALGLAAVDGAAVLATLYTAGIASLLGYGIFNTLLARNPSAAVVPWVLLAPVVAMTAAWLLLGDLPTVGEAGGGLLLVLGVLLALRAPRGRSASAPALGVGRAVAGQGRERGADPTGGEVGTELVDLVEGAEAR